MEGDYLLDKAGLSDNHNAGACEETERIKADGRARVGVQKVLSRLLFELYDACLYLVGVDTQQSYSAQLWFIMRKGSATGIHQKNTIMMLYFGRVSVAKNNHIRRVGRLLEVEPGGICRFLRIDEPVTRFDMHQPKGNTIEE